MFAFPQIHICHVGCAPIGDWWKCHFVDAFWRLYCNAEAGGVIMANGKVIPMRPGELMLLPARNGWRSDCKGTVRHAHYAFYLLGISSEWARMAFSSPVLLGRVDWDKTFGNLGKPGGYRVDEAYRYHALLSRCVAESFARLPAAKLDEARSMRANAKAIEPALQAIERDYGRPWSISGLARLCRITPDHLTRVFRTSLGQTPQRFLRERRIMVAAQSLLESERSIEQVAEETGFANRYHFTRAFTEFMRVSPGAYRRTYGA